MVSHPSFVADNVCGIDVQFFFYGNMIYIELAVMMSHYDCSFEILTLILLQLFAQMFHESE